MDGQGTHSKREYAEQDRFRVDCGWPGGPIARIPAHDGLRGQDRPRAGVVPIRQFCSIKPPSGAEHAASFRHIDVSGFSDPSDGWGYENGRCTCAEGRAAVHPLPRMPPGSTSTSQHIGPDTWAREFYLQEALDDEAAVLLDRARSAGGIEENMWVDGGTGGDAHADSTNQGGGEAGLAWAGLSAAQKKIADRDFGSDHAVCYTTAGAIAGLERDPGFAKNGGCFLGNTAASGVATVGGMLLVAAPPQAMPAAGAGGRRRSVMFVPEVSLGLISDDMVTVAEERDNKGGLGLAAHHLVGGVVIASGSVCGILHA